MKKELCIILIVFTIIGCDSRNKLEIEFENHLLTTDRIILEKIVSSYDNLIETEYNGVADEFFSRIESNNPISNTANKQEYCELVKMFDESTLEYKSQNIKYDSVYISDQGNIIRIEQQEDISENELQFDEEIEMFPNSLTIEEQIEEIKENGYWRFISASSFTSALSKISDGKTEIQEYINAKDAVAYLSPQRMASSVLKSEIDVSNYFIKRIIAIELFIHQIKNEYGC